ncbi:MAG: baseplate J/gp47 family protein, partial [Leptospiraceae bacterium]|nr:baseplate J/gp47 family protein [Leptospiraceae bacterium]
KITGGKDLESDTERIDRFKEFIKSFFRSTLNGIRYAVKTTPGVKDYYVYDNVDPYTGSENPGWINVLLSDGTNTVSNSVLEAVRTKINGIEGDPENTGYRAGGTRLYVGKLLIQAINIFYEIDIKDDSDLEDSIVKTLVETAIINYVNGLKSGNDVILDSVKAYGRTAHPDFYKIRTPGINTDIVVNNGYVPKIGGSGGGVIICNKINRVKVL